MTQFQAITDKIIIKPVKVPTHTESGIYIPKTARETKPIGTVVSVGERVKSVKVGDKVLYKLWEKTELVMNGKLYYILEDKPEHILAIINED